MAWTLHLEVVKPSFGDVVTMKGGGHAHARYRLERPVAGRSRPPIHVRAGSRVLGQTRAGVRPPRSDRRLCQSVHGHPEAAAGVASAGYRLRGRHIGGSHGATGKGDNRHGSLRPDA
ncbi:hypothetical protein DESC_880103 [Desulfosarcina cetonica]|nr:hypothetical protein DESC_880103 [Desulfosarcina cetonica]